MGKFIYFRIILYKKNSGTRKMPPDIRERRGEKNRKGKKYTNNKD